MEGKVNDNERFKPSRSVPPSKSFNRPEYNDRLFKLKQVQKEKNNLDFRMLIIQRQYSSAAHYANGCL